MKVMLVSLLVLIALYFYSRRDRRYNVAQRLPILRAAIVNERDISMIYFTYASRRFSRRVVTPIEIQDIQGRAYLRAYDHFRDAERTFKVARIKELTDVTRSRNR
jgi:predicted DNA-binding transcriptional regulator YafY